ncbi:MAG: DUF4956 domain-containing protein [Bacteroidota bacterium]
MSVLKLFLLIGLLLPAGTGVLKAQDNASQETVQDDGTDKKKKKKNPDVSEEDFFQFALERLNFIFFMRLLIDVVTMIVLIGLIYYPNYNKKDFFFTFFMFNIVMFFITYLLNKVELSTGAAFGLFAVFSLLRYRTEDISAKDMTYLFVVIAIGLVTAVNKGNLFEICVINAIIILFAFFLDGNLLLRQEMIKNIQYDNIEMIKPENHAALMEDLKKRTGLEIHKVSIGRVDYLRDTATVKIYYYEKKKNA